MLVTPNHCSRADCETHLIAQIEMAAGIENAERIAAVDGIGVRLAGWIARKDMKSPVTSVPKLSENASVKSTDGIEPARRA